jgi:hypothetical protein
MPTPIPQNERKVKVEDVTLLAREATGLQQDDEIHRTQPESDTEDAVSLAELQVRACAYTILGAQQ